MKRLFTIFIYLLLSCGIANAGPTISRPSAFDPASPGAIGGTTPAAGTFTPGVTLTDGTDTGMMRYIQETGLGGRLTIGLDETTRTMVICDAGDVDTDFGLAVTNYPSLYIASPDGAGLVRLGMYNATNSFLQLPGGASGVFNIWDDATTALNLVSRTQSMHLISTDKASLNPFSFHSSANIELTDDNGEQSWLYAEPKINQSGTAAYNGIHVNVLETTPGTSIGDGSSGQGNNLCLLERESVPYFKVDRAGMVTFNTETVTCVTEAGTASISIRTSLLVTDGDADTDEDTVTLAAGGLGDEKVFVYLTETDVGDSVNVTPAGGLGFTKILFEDPGDGCIMVSTPSGWSIVSNNGGTIS